MDYQNDVVTNFVPTGVAMLSRAAHVLERARAAAIPVIQVVCSSAPDIPPPKWRTGGLFKMVRAMTH